MTYMKIRERVIRFEGAVFASSNPDNLELSGYESNYDGDHVRMDVKQSGRIYRIGLIHMGGLAPDFEWAECIQKIMHCSAESAAYIVLQARVLATKERNMVLATETSLMVDDLINTMTHI